MEKEEIEWCLDDPSNIWDLAVDIFGDEEEASVWFCNPQQGLNNEIPGALWYLGKENYERVYNLLHQIKGGN